MTQPTPEDASWPELHRVRRAIVVVDVVESVRLMQADEAGTIDRWRRFVHEVRTDVLPKFGGRMVKSLGDGMLLEFESAPAAIAAARDVHARLRGYNVGRSAEQVLAVRCAAHVTDIVVDREDVYGAGVNLVSRLATLGSPGDTLLSVEARDELVPDLDARLEDLGPCWLKHIDGPVRAFRVTPTEVRTTGHELPDGRATEQVLGITVAVVPLHCSGAHGTEVVVGDIVADSIVMQLSRTADLSVISRLSTAGLRGRDLSGLDLQQVTGARYIVSGNVAVLGSRAAISIELAEAAGRTVVWMERAGVGLAELVEEHCAALDALVLALHRAITQHEALRAASNPLPSLEAFSLLYGGVGLLHRASERDFARAGQALTALSERVPRHGMSYAWLAQWHCLRIARGQPGSTTMDRVAARQRIEQALERDPDSALAWALRGMVSSWVDKDLVLADHSLEQALGRNHSEPLAWLYTCTLRSWQGRGAEAVAAAERALALSPLHPMRYYYETLAASGYLAGGRFASAIELCERSLRTNRSHTPTHRVLAIAQWHSGLPDAARRTVSAMRQLQPTLTASAYLDNYPGGHAPHAVAYAEALREAGLPP